VAEFSPTSLLKCLSSEYNVLTETYDDLMVARKIIRVTDKRTDKPMLFSMTIDDMALRIAKNPEDVYLTALRSLAERIEKQRSYEGRDIYSGTKLFTVSVCEGPDYMRKETFVRPSPPPKPVPPEVTDRKKLVKYGRY
jgi:hypothetical protein